jgi:hypothetical protein
MLNLPIFTNQRATMPELKIGLVQVNNSKQRSKSPP